MVEDVDVVGLEAVIRGVGVYAANAGKVVSSNKAINASLKAAARTAGIFQKALRTALKVGALAIVAGLALSTFAFVNFDKAMTESIAIMGDVSDTMRDDMEVAARDVAKTTTFSMKQAAESFFFLASAGLSATQSIAALPQVAQFAQAGMFDMALATDLLTDAQSALGLTVDNTAQNITNMARVSDVLVKANTLANATVQQFSESLTREGGAALKSFNKDIEEGVAVLAAFADQGIKGQVAGSSLSRIIRLLSTSAIKNEDAFERLNIEVFDSSGTMRNLADIIEDMENALLGMSDKTRSASLEQLGFKARIQGVILPLLGTSEAIREYEAGLRSAAGITQEVADKQLQSLGAQFSLLRSGIEDLLFTIGQALEPALRSFVATIRNDVIPWVGVKLPRAIDEVKETFEEWKPVLKESAQFLNDVREAVVSFGQWILDNQAALVVAIVAIGVAFIWATPAGGIAAGIGAITLAVGIFKGDLDELEGVALNLRIEFLKLGRDMRIFVRDLSVLGIRVGRLTDLIGLTEFTRDIAALNVVIEILESRARGLNQTGFVTEQLDAYRGAIEDVIVAVSFGIDRTLAINQAMLNWIDTLTKSDRAAFNLAKTDDALFGSIFNIARAVRDAGEETAVFAIRLLQGAEATAILTEQLNALASSQGLGAAFARLARFGALIASLKAEIGGAPPSGGPLPSISPPGGGVTGNIIDAADELAEEGRRRWEKAIAAWIGAIVLGIRAGTITVLDAIREFENEAIGRATFIVDALVAEEFRIATEFEVMADIIARGFATVRDAQRLFELGSTEAALQILRTVSGEETDLAAEIRRIRLQRIRAIFPTAQENFQFGGFVPAGQRVQATLHGPELVVPLGSNTMAMRGLAQVLQGLSLGSGNGGFRNFGSISVMAGSDHDTEVVRSITRALGV